MLKRLRAKHPIGFCILAEVLFLGSLILASCCIIAVLLVSGADLNGVSDYLIGSIQETVGLLVTLFLLARTGQMGLLRHRGSGFFNGLLVGMYPLLVIGMNLCARLVGGMPEDTPLLPAFQIFCFFLNMTLVGIAEEFLFRGIVARTLLDHYGTSRGGIWKACLLSGLLFGLSHLSNLLSSALFGVLMQCVFAASLGTLFAAIYFRTGNLWVTVFLHAAMDITSPAGRRPVRDGGRGREHLGLRCLHADLGAGLSDPDPLPAAEKEAGRSAALFRPAVSLAPLLPFAGKRGTISHGKPNFACGGNAALIRRLIDYGMYNDPCRQKRIL